MRQNPLTETSGAALEQKDFQRIKKVRQKEKVVTHLVRLSVLGWPLNPCKEVSAPYPIQDFHNSVWGSRLRARSSLQFLTRVSSPSQCWREFVIEPHPKREHRLSGSHTWRVLS